MIRSMHAVAVETPNRYAVFIGVGMIGFLLQFMTLALLAFVGGVGQTTATCLAVEVAVLHNFLWHERWTWRGRRGTSGMFARLVRFNMTNGALSIAGNLVVTRLLTGTLGWPLLMANACAVIVISVLNFVAADRWVFAPAGAGEAMRTLGRAAPGARRWAVSLVMVGAYAIPASGAELDRGTIAAWDRYVAVVERRIDEATAGSLHPPRLERTSNEVRCLDEGQSLAAASARAFVTPRVEGAEVPLQGGTIHRWCGAVFVPNARLDAVLEAMRSGHRPLLEQTDVSDARVLSRRANGVRVYLRLVRRQIVTVTYNTEHETSVTRLDRNTGLARSVATRIAQVERPGTPDERERALGDDAGFLWRLNAYWRYQQIGSGVLVELESLTLSRDIPTILRPVAGPLVRRVARESMERTLSHVARTFESLPASQAASGASGATNVDDVRAPDRGRAGGERTIE